MLETIVGPESSRLMALRDAGGERARNVLLSSLPALERDALGARLERVRLDADASLMRIGERVQYVVFPDDAIIALSLDHQSQARARDLMTFGRDGIVGVPQVFVDGPAPVEAVVRLSGHARRMTADAFRDAVTRMPGLRRVVDRYAHLVFQQLARSIRCERVHAIEQRCATLLLSTADRTGSVKLPLTHEELGVMLGVRRAGVSEVASRLRTSGGISYSRGRITIDDRPLLERSACGCYAESDNDFREAFSHASGF